MEDVNMNEQNVNEMEHEETEKKKGWKRELLEWILVLLSAFIIAQLINNFVFRFARVDGPSMENTLHHNEYLLVWKLGYEPKCGDVIVFETDMNVNGTLQKQYLVKRVIATEGQTIEVDYETDRVLVDGKEIQEDYIKDADMFAPYQTQHSYPYTVEEDHVYVLGDNRNNSLDSRAKGAIPESDITGKVVFRLLPFDKIGTLN